MSWANRLGLSGFGQDANMMASRDMDHRGRPMDNMSNMSNMMQGNMGGRNINRLMDQDTRRDYNNQGDRYNDSRDYGGYGNGNRNQQSSPDEFETGIPLHLDKFSGSFDVMTKLCGKQGENLDYIEKTTGAKMRLVGRGTGAIDSMTGRSSSEPPQIIIRHPEMKGLELTEQLVESLLKSVQEDYQEHLESEYKNMENMLGLEGDVMGGASGMGNDPSYMGQGRMNEPLRYCSYCDINCRDETLYAIHCKGALHQQKIQDFRDREEANNRNQNPMGRSSTEGSGEVTHSLKALEEARGPEVNTMVEEESMPGVSENIYDDEMEDAASNSGNFVYYCEYCSIGVLRYKQLRTHWMLKHAKAFEGLQCPQCVMNFPGYRKSDLRRHLIRVHNLIEEQARIIVQDTSVTMVTAPNSDCTSSRLPTTEEAKRKPSSTSANSAESAMLPMDFFQKVVGLIQEGQGQDVQGGIAQAMLGMGSVPLEPGSPDMEVDNSASADGKASYYCNVCGGKFSKFKVLRRHWETKHAKEFQGLQCPQCQEAFPTNRKPDLRRHLENVHDFPEYRARTIVIDTPVQLVTALTSDRTSTSLPTWEEARKIPSIALGGVMESAEFLPEEKVDIHQEPNNPALPLDFFQKVTGLNQENQEQHPEGSIGDISLNSPALNDAGLPEAYSVAGLESVSSVPENFAMAFKGGKGVYHCDICGLEVAKYRAFRQHWEKRHAIEFEGFRCPVCEDAFPSTKRPELRRHLVYEHAYPPDHARMFVANARVQMVTTPVSDRSSSHIPTKEEAFRAASSKAQNAAESVAFLQKEQANLQQEPKFESVLTADVNQTFAGLEQGNLQQEPKFEFKHPTDVCKKFAGFAQDGQEGNPQADIDRSARKSLSSKAVPIMSESIKDMEVDNSLSADGKDLYYCNICGMGLTKYKSLRLHWEKRHAKVFEGLQCPECEETFSTFKKTDLRRHLVRTHLFSEEHAQTLVVNAPVTMVTTPISDCTSSHLPTRVQAMRIPSIKPRKAAESTESLHREQTDLLQEPKFDSAPLLHFVEKVSGFMQDTEDSPEQNPELREPMSMTTKRELEQAFTQLLFRQVQSGYVDELRGRCEYLAQSKPKPNLLPRNTRNKYGFCTICSKNVGRDAQDHLWSRDHREMYLMLQLNLGLKKFSQEYGDAAVPDMDTNGGRRLATTSLDDYFLGLDSLPGNVDPDLYKEVVIRLGFIYKFECEVCKVSLRNEAKWVQHVMSLSHCYKCITTMMDMGVAAFNSQIGHVPSLNEAIFQESIKKYFDVDGGSGYNDNWQGPKDTERVGLGMGEEWSGGGDDTPAAGIFSSNTNFNNQAGMQAMQGNFNVGNQPGSYGASFMGSNRDGNYRDRSRSPVGRDSGYRSRDPQNLQHEDGGNRNGRRSRRSRWNDEDDQPEMGSMAGARGQSSSVPSLLTASISPPVSAMVNPMVSDLVGQGLSAHNMPMMTTANMAGAGMRGQAANLGIPVGVSSPMGIPNPGRGLLGDGAKAMVEMGIGQNLGGPSIPAGQAQMGPRNPQMQMARSPMVAQQQINQQARMMNQMPVRTPAQPLMAPLMQTNTIQSLRAQGAAAIQAVMGTSQEGLSMTDRTLVAEVQRLTGIKDSSLVIKALEVLSSLGPGVTQTLGNISSINLLIAQLSAVVRPNQKALIQPLIQALNSGSINPQAVIGFKGKADDQEVNRRRRRRR